MACGQIESGRARYALVVGADYLSRFLDVSDRDTAPLFADGAGAALVSATEEPTGRIGPIVLRSDHSGSHLIRFDRGDLLRMDGQESFRAAVASMSDATTGALASCDCRPEDIGLFVYHQANSRIIRAVRERLGLPAERVVDYVDRFANTSTATLPIALSVAEAEGAAQARRPRAAGRVRRRSHVGSDGDAVERAGARPAAIQPSVTPTV